MDVYVALDKLKIELQTYYDILFAHCGTAVSRSLLAKGDTW